MSRSLVGSSRISTLGASISTRSRYSRRFSPPDSLAIGVYCLLLMNRNRSHMADAVISPSAVRTYSPWSFTISITVPESGSSSFSWPK